jgi:tRNA threonylcarbamoyladenosine biosynthesis protein TsaE
MSTLTDTRSSLQWTCELQDENATCAFARHLADLLFPGAVIGLIGEMGSGKTFLVRALASALGTPDSRFVNSPTFVLIQEYEGRWPIYHFDTYRLKHLRDFVDLGVHEYFRGEGVCLIEWADRVQAVLPEERLEIRIEITGPHSRRLTLTAFGERYVQLVKGLQQTWASFTEQKHTSSAEQAAAEQVFE